MVAENSIVRKYTILYNRWLPISWHLGSLFCHSKNTAINSLVANYFFQDEFLQEEWVGQKVRKMGSDVESKIAI